MTDRRLEEKPACSVISAPFPNEVKCQSCGHDIEAWSDDTKIKYEKCSSVFDNI